MSSIETHGAAIRAAEVAHAAAAAEVAACQDRLSEAVQAAVTAWTAVEQARAALVSWADEVTP